MKIVKTVLFITMLGVILAGTNSIFRYKTAYGIKQYESFYEQEDNTIDVLLVGSSHVYSDINPAVLWRENGVASFALSTGGAGLWNSYYAIKEALKTQTPKVIVLEVYTAAASADFRTQREQMDANFAMKKSLDAIEQIQVSTERQNWISLFLEYPYYHKRYTDIDISDFGKYQNRDRNGFWLHARNNKKSYKGAVMLYRTSAFESFPDLKEWTETGELTEKNLEYLMKIIQLTKDNQIPLQIIVSPYIGINRQNQRIYNKIGDIAAENDVSYINFNHEVTKLKLDIQKDFAESSHLNFRGAEKYSSYLSQYLTDAYQLPNHKGNEAYSSWNDNQRWEERAYRNQLLKEEKDVERYINTIMSNKDYTCVFFVSPNSVRRNDGTDTYVSVPNICEILETGGALVTDGQAIKFNGLALDSYFYHTELDNNDLAVSFDRKENGIIYNAENMTKVKNGLNILVYDNYSKYLVDVVGFDAAREWQCIR